MNITFRLPSEDLEKTFVKESAAAGLDGLEGAPLRRRHPGVALQRLPRGGVDELVNFMKEFERSHG